MTERKPAGMGFESWLDKQIREAQERGEFDNLPGTGKPLENLGRSNDELWWVKQKLAREGETTDALLPTPLKLRKEIHQLADSVRHLRTEQAVRDAVDELNERIMAWLRAPSGPLIQVGRVNADDVVAQWRADRAADQAAAATVSAGAAASASPSKAVPERARTKTSWWHRLTRRGESS